LNRPSCCCGLESWKSRRERRGILAQTRTLSQLRTIQRRFLTLRLFPHIKHLPQLKQQSLVKYGFHRNDRSIRQLLVPVAPRFHRRWVGATPSSTTVSISGRTQGGALQPFQSSTSLPHASPLLTLSSQRPSPTSSRAKRGRAAPVTVSTTNQPHMDNGKTRGQ
jgi:hypothetical protein